MTRQRSNWIPPNRFRGDEHCVGDIEQLQCDGVLPTLLLWSELQVLQMEPGMVDDLGGDAWNKSHRGVLDKQKASPSVLEELDEPELSPDLDELRCYPQSQSKSRERRLASATNLATYPLT